MWVTVCPAQQQSPKQKKGENIPMTLLDLVIYHVNSEKSENTGLFFHVKHGESRVLL